MTEEKLLPIMVGYADNHMRDTYKLYNPETKRVVITRDVKWVDCKMTDPVETLKICAKHIKKFCARNRGRRNYYIRTRRQDACACYH